MDHSITLPKHIQVRLDYFYGTRDYRAYITDILSDSRDGERQGFPPAIALHLFKLLQEHDLLFPQWIPPPKPWEIQ